MFGVMAGASAPFIWEESHPKQLVCKVAQESYFIVKIPPATRQLILTVPEAGVSIATSSSSARTGESRVEKGLQSNLMLNRY